MSLFYGNGMNFENMCRLRYSNMDHANNEIIFKRKKTLNRRRPQNIYVSLLPPLQIIINRIWNKELTGYIFPFLNGVNPVDSNELKIKRAISLRLSTINDTLKRIAGILKVDPGLSTSHARNSYISYLASELYINDTMIKHMVGHSSRDVTAGYNTPKPSNRLDINKRLLDLDRKYAVIGAVKVV